MKIREAIDIQYSIIKEANEKLIELRKQCSHKNTKKKPYQWRPGRITESLLCGNIT